MVFYYDSFRRLFDEWATQYADVAHLTDMIIDGKNESYDFNMGPILNKLSQYYEEIEFILDSVPSK